MIFFFQLTALIAGVATHINTCFSEKAFFMQLYKVGIIVEFEGLLSCYGDEMGMLEDMTIAVDDLGGVTFTLCQQTEEHSTPTVSLHR